MRKLAKIESPSPDEKKHISEEAMYIDQPVVDNAKNNKILYKRSMKKMGNYDVMVKSAYENIVDGFDKEAKARWKEEYSNLSQGAVDRLSDAGLKPTPAAIARIKEIAGKTSSAAKKHPLLAAGVPVATAATLGSIAAAKALKKKNQPTEEEVAEKAAAYYEAAVMAKEAAENDYANACAYEDAAIQILDELGLLED